LLRFLMPKPAFGEQFEPENKLIEGQPNEYLICKNASVLAFHLWPTIGPYLPERRSGSKMFAEIAGTAFHRVSASLHGAPHLCRR